VSLALGLPARADPNVLRFSDPTLEVTVPQGFAPCPGASNAPDVLACRQRRSPAGASVVLTLVRLQGEVPQGRRTVAELSGLRRADPFVFDDAREEAVALGFTLDTLAGHGTVPGSQEAVFRLATVLPLASSGVLVSVLAPGPSEPEARAVFQRVLSSARGTAGWRTPGEQRVALAARVGATLAVVVTLGYPLVVGLFLRGREGHRVVRAAALGAGAAGWAVLAAACVALDGREGAVPAAVFASLGVSLAVFAGRVWRRRVRPPAG
jgi:hypothetical protein